MAPRTLTRRALRDQNDAAELDEREEVTDSAEDAPKPNSRKKAAELKTPAKPKAPAKPRVRRKAVKVPARMVARWAVCDNTAKRVAMFEYKDRVDADARLVEVRERKPGAYFYLVLVKDPFDPPVEPATTVANA